MATELPADIAAATERVTRALETEFPALAEVETQRAWQSLSTDRAAVRRLGYSLWKDVPADVRDLLCACRALAFCRAAQVDDGSGDGLEILARTRREVWALARGTN